MVDGVVESRKSFLYGYFCCIYGLGACLMVVSLQYFNKSKKWLFIGGFIIGSIVEYSISLYGDFFLNLKWWDYSQFPFNINGRVCLIFSMLWGGLAVVFMMYIHPIIDKSIDFIKVKMSGRKLKIVILSIMTFIFVDVIVSIYAVDAFLTRKIHEYNINVENKDKQEEKYEKIYGNERLAKFIYKYYNDETIIKAFPNLKMSDANGNIIYLNKYVKNINPYFYKIK